MRFKSKSQNGFQIFAVTGINTVSFGIKASEAARKDLLGFSVERIDAVQGERYILPGMKVFPSVIPNPDESTRVSTWDHPIQSFVWDDFTAKQGQKYSYLFHPVRGKPKKLVHDAPVEITIETEKLFTTGTHDVFFNRGVASSQAYARQFRNQRPDKIADPVERQRALDWLSRNLDDALLKFIAQARKGDALYCCFYEFRYLPAATALAEALARGVDMKLIIDAKVNEYTDKNGICHESFPRVENLKTIRTAKIPKAKVVLREMRPGDIQHNKFMVLQRKGKLPQEVWTGSTNLSMGGIHGQTNVGHWVRDDDTAAAFKAYWDILAGDPGAADGTTAEGRQANAAFKKEVELASPGLDADAEVAQGITPIFSPRKGLGMLERYIAMLAGAESGAAITLAFGVNKDFKTALATHGAKSALTFLLLEKEDKPKKDSEQAWVSINARQNVYKAWGSFLGDAVYQFARETNARRLGLNTHVSYVHSKFMLIDPLGADPVVVTGSANFSAASTTANDENMLIIRGDRRAADIYFTEFNRIFFHYYFRSVVEATSRFGEGHVNPPADAPQFLKERPEQWLKAYAPGKLKDKRVQLLASMKGF
jgi:phosphatidylserine/phosphatidylglycerophosphate/cardiolipin synthase-like enzyme